MACFIKHVFPVFKVILLLNGLYIILKYLNSQEIIIVSSAWFPRCFQQVFNFSFFLLTDIFCTTFFSILFHSRKYYGTFCGRVKAW